MVLNKKTIHSATGQYMMRIIYSLLSITSAKDIQKSSELRKDIDKLLKVNNDKDAILEIL